MQTEKVLRKFVYGLPICCDLPPLAISVHCALLFKFALGFACDVSKIP